MVPSLAFLALGLHRLTDRYYRWITYLFLPIQYAGFLFTFHTIATTTLSTVDKIGLAVAIGCVGRPLLHRAQPRPPRPRRDPAGSRVGESFYRFWPRTVYGSLKSALRLERKRYARRDKHPFRIGNDVFNAWLMSAVLWAR